MARSHERRACAGGEIVLQLWHVGRISHTSLLPNGASPVSSTNRAVNAKTFTADGYTDVSTPRALRDDELPALVADYRKAASNAIKAGFDGVEVHAANTYLLEQFLRDIVKMIAVARMAAAFQIARLLVEVVQAVTEEIGGGRTGIRLSPMTTFSDTALDSDPQALYNYVVEQIAPFNLAYLHVIEGETGGSRQPASSSLVSTTLLCVAAFPAS